LGLYLQAFLYIQILSPVTFEYLASTLVTLGLTLTRAGKLAEGELYLREALHLRRQSPAQDHWAVAHTESALGECLTSQKRYAEAESLLLKSHPILQSKLGDRHPRTVDAVERLARLYNAWKQPEKAAQYQAMLPRQ
jgi:tetratricopeptide (TPR) repeat protein